MNISKGKIKIYNETKKNKVYYIKLQEYKREKNKKKKKEKV